MKKPFKNKILLAILLVFMCFTDSFAIEQDKIPTTIQTNINQALKLLKESPKQDSKALQNIAEKIFVLFDPLFDYPLMAQLSLAQSYKTLNQEQIQTFNQVFEENLKKSFTDKLKLYKDEKLEVLNGEQIKSNRYNLKISLLINGELNFIILKFYTNDNRDWKIYDVDVLGISIIQTYRSQISDILANGDFQMLINNLQNEFSFETK